MILNHYFFIGTYITIFVFSCKITPFYKSKTIKKDMEMMFRFTPLALALFAVGTQAYAANDTAAQAVQTKELDTVQVRGRRLVMETGYKAERSDITGVNTSILDTPYSIDTVTKQQLEDKQPHMLEDALVGISGLHQGNNMARSNHMTVYLADDGKAVTE